jgi:DNA primase
MHFPQTFIDDLRRQADIVRVVQDYVPSLKKKGANWQACCPFHQEKTPSFSVNPAKEIFYCFGCAEGGSVFNFVMKIENVAFPEAVKIVAAKANVPLPQMEHDQRFEQRRQEADVVMQLNGWALEFWERQLQADTPDARAAREYLHGRGIADETRAKFRLGYAPERWDALLNYLKQKGATLEQLTKSGLVVVKEDGKMYDRFRGRVMFPVLDAQGRAVAFGGRVMGSGEPKYLNSPETAAYVKGRHLYGLFQNREEIKRRKFTILVEGYLDLIIPYQFGVRNMVASLGTALTPEQAKLLARFARRAVVNYDGDSAGVKAARRAIEVLLTEDFELKVLVLPEGADPDEFVRKHGAEEYNQRRGEAAPHIQFVIAQAVRERNLQHPSDKAAAVEDVFPFLRAVRNPIQRREYFDRAMNELLVEADLRRQLWETIRQTNPNAGKSNVDVSETVLRASRTPPTLAERKLLAMLLTDAELRVAFTPLLTPADYAELPTAAIFGALLEAAPDETDWPARLAHDPWAQEILPEILAPAIGQAQRAAGEALDEFLHEAQKCLVQLRLMLSERRLQEIRARVSVAQRAGDQAEADRLLLEQFQWDKYKRNLLSQVAG